MVKVTKILGNIDEIDLFRQFTAALSNTLPNAEEEALLVDLTAIYDRKVEAMRVARKSMQRGFYLPERAYPITALPSVKSPESAFVLSIIRQETGFDPGLKSHANARGMMQLIPSTARAVSRRLGLPYSEANLYESQYNMSLGAFHLQELVDQFSGSYIMAAAGYNAGPTRMRIWIDQCGDPRGESADALSFIECMPLKETRDYMMRVTENMRIYRARLNGGSAPLTAHSDIVRGIAVSFAQPDPDTSELGSGSTEDLASANKVSYIDYQKNEADTLKTKIDADALAIAQTNKVKAKVSPKTKTKAKSKTPTKSKSKSKAKPKVKKANSKSKKAAQR
jgi:soluble lytic murein transglycosylase